MNSIKMLQAMSRDFRLLFEAGELNCSAEEYLTDYCVTNLSTIEYFYDFKGFLLILSVLARFYRVFAEF